MDQYPKGICRLAVVPMRANASHEAIMLSQLLFGEHYQVLRQEGEWLEIEVHFDHSKGWIHQDQHSAISQEYFKQINLSDYKVCTDLSATIFFQKKKVHIVLGSILPISTNELFKLEEQIAYNGSSKSLSQRRDFDFLKEEIKKYDNAPYLPGGKTPFGIDSAGFVQQVFKLCGFKLPRKAVEQKSVGKKVDGVDSLLPGDIAVDELQDRVYILLEKNVWMGVNEGAVRRLSNHENIDASAIFRRILREA